MNTQSESPFGLKAAINQATTQSEIDKALQIQRSWITTIEETLAALHQKLTPILSASNPTSTTNEKRMGSACQLGEMLEANNDRIIAIATSLQDIQARTQL